jgi:alkanesulfonate monooxygenase SsuD/methylene tetrahydromethanopterin reductase-like flavin-dependent oxidoreductase (luciferase family)
MVPTSAYSRADALSPHQGDALKFGVFYDFRNPPHAGWHQPWSKFYDATFEHMQEVERLGFDKISISEHHGDPDGYNIGMPVTLAIAADRTKSIRLGPNIIQIPYYHPVVVAEQFAAIDIISGGRLDVGLGQVPATFNAEYSMFGVNPRFRPSLLEEALDIMQRCWSESEPFDYHGKRWNLENIWVNPKPLQDPLPLFVVASSTDVSMDRVASRGLDVGGPGGFWISLTGTERWKQWLSRWRQACVRNGRDPNYAKINVFSTCFVTDDPEKAWAKHRDGILYSFNYERDGVRPYSSRFVETIPQKPEDLPGWEHICQTPEQAIAELRDAYTDGAPTELNLMAIKPGMSFEESLEYLKNFAEKVIPAVKGL